MRFRRQQRGISAAHRSFWEQVALAVHMRGWEVDIVGPRGDIDNAEQEALFGTLDGFDLQVGCYERVEGGGDQQRSYYVTYVSVLVEGLMPDFVGAESGPAREWFERLNEAPFRKDHGQPLVSGHLDCGNGKAKKVAAVLHPLDLGGLRVGYTLEVGEFLSASQQSAVCSLTCEVLRFGDMHHVWAAERGLPFPSQRQLDRAMAGDTKSIQILNQHRDRAVALVRRALVDADVVSRSLRMPGDIVPPSRRLKKR